ncbi:aminotransferase class I/II-fold pyridoxal phosphate-dependent enzyme [Candidatus Eisenbacteria bacterium]|uniref:Aminotransferase class I/II-fold pyridoxal phosphate-dependent enzyme n=1 Tax=Eiseniibacteriota bacterium TaxID=2212470 RepID=A0ABV6YM69_UNCEI
MGRNRSNRKDRKGMSRRVFFGAAAGSAALAALKASPVASVAHAQDRMLRDYVGRLCYNENPLGPSPNAIAAMSASLDMGHRYPEWFAESLKSDLATLHDVDAGQIVAGCGATEILRLCAYAFADPAGNVVSPQPSYNQFPGDAEFLGAEVRYADLDVNYRVDLGRLDSLVNMDTTAVIITNPNNPTGPVLAATDLASFIDSMPPGVVVIIDEAYHEYVQDVNYESAMEQVRQDKNVVVVRTFSKVFGMAGIRVGYAVGKQELISSMKSWHLFATISRPGIEAARAALTDSQHITDSVTLNEQAKQYCYSELTAMGLEYIPSESNFFMVDVGSANYVHSELEDRGIKVRTYQSMPDHIRVSTGTMQEMEDFIAALLEILSADVPAGAIPKTTALYGNYPNPARGVTRITYWLSKPSDVRLQVFDIRGRLVRTLVQQRQPAGQYNPGWDRIDQAGRPVTAGTYFCKLEAGDFEQVRRMILL